MTPDRSHDRDSREDIECLAHRARILLPEVILRDGSASPKQVAIVPAGVILAKAFLPHREIDGPPATWTGAAIVGTREPDMAPYIDGFGTVPFALGSSKQITQPDDREFILSWLYDMTGYRYAPAAFCKVAGWEIVWIANFLHRCHEGGAMAELIVAERQAAAAVHAMWIVHSRSNADPCLVEESGCVLAGRALVDMAMALGRCIGPVPMTETAHDQTVTSEVAAALESIAQHVGLCIRSFIEADCAADRFSKRAKLGRAINHARAVVDAVGLFTVKSEPLSKCVVRLRKSVSKKNPAAQAAPTHYASVVEQAARDLETLSIAGLPDLPRRARWCEITAAGLDRLQTRDAAERGAALKLVRMDLVYKLIVTRRLDRIFEALPWMLAPSGAFPLTFGGPLGAVATLFEAGRVREAGLELKRRLYERVGSARLDTRRGIRTYGDPNEVALALHNQTRAGFLLVSDALSHATAQAFLAGKHLGAAHPLPTLAAGSTGWSFKISMSETGTMETVTDVELNKSIYTTASYDRDLPRYMGMTLGDFTASALVDLFPGGHRGPGFGTFTRLEDAQREATKQGKSSVAIGTSGGGNRELLRSVLKSLDSPTDGDNAEWRGSGKVIATPCDVELQRFDERHAGHVGRRARDGGAIRRRVSKITIARGSPGKALQVAVDKARMWSTKNDGVGREDRPLAELLSGRSSLPGLMPQAQEVAAVLWFRPQIDSHIHDWIGAGAPMSSPLALSGLIHAGLIAEEVQILGKKLPGLFGMPIPPDLRRRILVPLWTGLAGITADHAHVHKI